MRQLQFLFSALVFTALLGIFGCAESKKKIWIEPPSGYLSGNENSKILYEVENMESGKKESLVIPLSELPEHLLIEDQGRRVEGKENFAATTSADRMMISSKVDASKNTNQKPKVSYLRGIDSVNNLFQKGKYTDALIHLAPLIEAYPQKARLHMMQGTLYQQIGEKKLSLRAYRRAHQIDPTNLEVENAILDLQTGIGIEE